MDKPFNGRAVARRVAGTGGKSWRYDEANEHRKNLPDGFAVQELSLWHWRLTSGDTVVDYWPTKQRALTMRGEPKFDYWHGTLQQLVEDIIESRTKGHTPITENPADA